MTMFMKKLITCICVLSHHSGFLQSPPGILVAVSNDYVSVFHSPACGKGCNISSLLDPLTFFPPLALFGGLLDLSPGYCICSLSTLLQRNFFHILFHISFYFHLCVKDFQILTIWMTLSQTSPQGSGHRVTTSLLDISLWMLPRLLKFSKSQMELFPTKRYLLSPCTSLILDPLSSLPPTWMMTTIVSKIVPLSPVSPPLT